MSLHFSKLGLIGRTYQHLQRYRHILGVFHKYGYEDFVKRLGLSDVLDVKFVRTLTVNDEAILKLSAPVRLRLACEELGPTFVKAGQILSQRPDLVPHAYVVELEKLQDQLTPLPFPEVSDLLLAEFKRPLDQIFSWIEETPLAAASIAQVHRARLVSGADVVVKVQYPRLQEMIEVDLEIMLHIAGLMENHLEGWKLQRPTAVVAEVGRSLQQEIDFTLEASHIERFARQFVDDRDVVVPRVYHEASTRRILTMEYMPGIKASETALLLTAGLDLRVVATRIADLLMKQFFVHGFFHADPHPGNVFVLPGARICFLDFGMMGYLDDRTRTLFADLIWGIAERNESMVSSALLKMSDSELEPSRVTMEKDVSEFIHHHFYRPAREMEFGRLITQLLHISTKHHLRMQPDLFIMLKALGLMEALVRNLNPDHDIIEQASPFLANLRMNRYKPERLAKALYEFSGDFAELARQLPGELRKILSQLKTGEAQINFRHQGLEPMENALDRVSNRLSFAIVLAALIIGSSLMVLANLPPKIYDIPVIGLVGFIIAGLMGFRLLIAILRSGKM